MHSQAAAAQPPSAQQDTHRWATFVSRHGNIWTAVEEASQGALSGFGPESGETASGKLVQDLHQIGLAPKRSHAAAAHCPASRAGEIVRITVGFYCLAPAQDGASRPPYKGPDTPCTALVLTATAWQCEAALAQSHCHGNF